MTMIIFGWRGRWTTLWQGWFACPYERDHRQGRLREARRWFTLFFIPVIPLGRLGRVVECSGCGLQFDERVLAVHEPAAAPVGEGPQFGPGPQPVPTSIGRVA